MQNDITYDWINQVPVDIGAEGEDNGNGNPSDYEEQVPSNIHPEDIAPESEVPSGDTAAHKKSSPRH